MTHLHSLVPAITRVYARAYPQVKNDDVVGLIFTGKPLATIIFSDPSPTETRKS